MKFVERCVARPVVVTMLMAALAGLGIYSYQKSPREMFPKVDMPIVTVSTVYEGAGPDEIEQLISKELEEEISTVEGIKNLESISQQGLSIVMVEFYLGTDVDAAAADVRAKVNLVQNELPDAAFDPVTMKFDFSAMPILVLSVSADRPLKEIYDKVDQLIKDRISTVPGVASVEVVGGEEREIHILTSQQRLRAYGINITDIALAIAAANLESPGGHFSQSEHEYNLRIRGKFTDLDQIRDLPVTLPDGKTEKLRTFAEVKDSFKEIRERARADGETCVGLNVKKRSEGNTVAVDREIKEQVAQLLANQLTDDYRIVVQDEQAPWITASINNVFENMGIGILLTAVALFLFLHSARATGIISFTMPISVAATFIVMFLMDFSINLMSMMGLAMTIGVLVNNAILVLENITRYLHLGHEPKLAAVEGTSEIAVAVSSTTLTNVVVFVPIAFMGGIVGQFFRDFGLTAAFATVVSLLVSFTLAPMLASKILTKENTSAKGKSILDRIGQRFDKGLDGLKVSYGKALAFCLNHRIIVTGMTLLLFVGSLSLGGLIGMEFITSMDQGKFIVSLEMPVGTRFEETDRAVAEIETVLSNQDILPELKNIYSSIGKTSGGDIGGSSQAVNIAQIMVNVVDKEFRERSTENIMNDLRGEFAKTTIPGARIKLLEISGGGGGAAPIQMQIVGDDIDRIRKFSEKAMVVMKDPTRVPGTLDVDTNFRIGQPEIRIIPDKDKCRDAMVDTRYLSSVVAATFEGLIMSEYTEGAFNYDIRVKSDEQSRRDRNDVENLTIINQMGQAIPLAELATIEDDLGPAQLFRKNRQSMIKVSCDVSETSPGEVVRDIETHLAPLLEEYPDCSIVFTGDIQMMEESNKFLGEALLMAVCLTYALLAALLESFTQPLVIMISLPLSLIGVFWALFLMGGTFSIFSIMSIIMLVGLVINNSIIVIDYVNTLRRRGVARYDAIIESGTTRLRPILMANLTTVVALIPLAMGRGFGGEMMSPMAMVQIGGLIAGGWMGLLIVPVIFTISDDFNCFVISSFKRKPKTETTPEPESVPPVAES
ncbi:MAG: efflux RND transporter permease subunit [Planctomycetes bacterium]|nr:efflux RND transporter permease subunit [Planctomycetota bacterium]